MTTTIYKCAVCNHLCSSSELLWDDPNVPTCPCCFIMDMLMPITEADELPPPPAEVINWV